LRRITASVADLRCLIYCHNRGLPQSRAVADMSGWLDRRSG